MDKRVDKHLITLIIVIVSLGSIMVFNTSMYMSFITKDSPYALFLKHLVFLFVALLFGFIAYKVPLYVWKKLAIPLYVIGNLMLIYLLIMGPVIKHTRRWLKLGPVTLQVSEFMKFAIILFIAYWIEKYEDRMAEFKHGFLIPALAIIFPAILIALEPSYSMAGVVTVAGFITLFLGRLRWKYLIIFMIIVSLLFPVLLTRKKYTARKMDKIVNVWKSTGEQVKTDQTYISIVFTGSGGIIGKGLGKGRSKMATVQEVYRDFVFAVIGEETGFIGGLFVILLYFLLFNRMYLISLNSKDPFVFVSVIGIGSVLLFMALLHIATNIGIFPNTGVPLPFMTVGGSSLLMNMIALGYVLSSSKYSGDYNNSIRKRRTDVIKKNPVYSNWRYRRSYNSRINIGKKFYR